MVQMSQPSDFGQLKEQNTANNKGRETAVPFHAAAIAVESRVSLKTSLRHLDSIRPLYFLPRDPFADEVLIPAFAIADRVDCMVGFFSSAILADLAPGLATYLSRPEHKFRLVISPILSTEDQRAIEEGVKSLDDVMTELMEQALITVDQLQQHTLRCLAHLLRHNAILGPRLVPVVESLMRHA